MPQLIAPCNVPGFVFLVKRIQSTEYGRDFLNQVDRPEYHLNMINNEKYPTFIKSQVWDKEKHFSPRQESNL